MTEITQVLAAVAAEEIEVSAKAKRRRFTAKEKLRILKLADGCTRSGELGALLRSEGIYSSSLYSWRQARARGELAGLTSKKRGPVAKVPSPLEREHEELKKALAKSEARLKRAELVIEVQKKIADLLGIQLPKNDEKS